MSEFVYYLLATNSQTASDKALELGMNPHSYNYKSLSDPRRSEYKMLLVVDRADGYILFSNLVKEFDESTLEVGAPIHIVN